MSPRVLSNLREESDPAGILFRAQAQRSMMARVTRKRRWADGEFPWAAGRIAAGCGNILALGMVLCLPVDSSLHLPIQAFREEEGPLCLTGSKKISPPTEFSSVDSLMNCFCLEREKYYLVETFDIRCLAGRP
jgi:hypothetical protein